MCWIAIGDHRQPGLQLCISQVLKSDFQRHAVHFLDPQELPRFNDQLAQRPKTCVELMHRGLQLDGRRIAYVALKDGVPNICTMDIDGGQQRQITQRKTPCGRVRWSPDGKHLAFVSFEGELPQLFVVAAEGGEPRQITRLKGAVTQLSWRPAAQAP